MKSCSGTRCRWARWGWRHPDGERAFAACMDGVYQLNLSCGERAQLYGHRSYASGVVCIHEQEMIVSAGYDGALQWYDLASGKIVRHVQAHSFWSWDLARSAAVPIIASCSGEHVGEGLMETLAFHPNGKFFVMAGRLRGGSWNTGIFDVQSSDLIHSFKTDTRVTKAQFSADGSQLLLASADKQAAKADKEFGAVDVYSVHITAIEKE